MCIYIYIILLLCFTWPFVCVCVCVCAPLHVAICLSSMPNLQSHAGKSCPGKHQTQQAGLNAVDPLWTSHYGMDWGWKRIDNPYMSHLLKASDQELSFLRAVKLLQKISAQGRFHFWDANTSRFWQIRDKRGKSLAMPHATHAFQGIYDIDDSPSSLRDQPQIHQQKSIYWA